jgi:hypothetical protein
MTISRAIQIALLALFAVGCNTGPVDLVWDWGCDISEVARRILKAEFVRRGIDPEAAPRRTRRRG